MSRTPTQGPVLPHRLYPSRAVPARCAQTRSFLSPFLLLSFSLLGVLHHHSRFYMRSSSKSDAFFYIVQLNEAIFLLSPAVIHPWLRHIPYLQSSTKQGAPFHSPRRASAYAGSDKARWQDLGSRAPWCKHYQGNGVLQNDPSK